MSLRDRIERNLHEIRERIEGAAFKSARKPEDIRLVAVTKSVGPAEIEALCELGLSDFGENRVESAAEKIAAADAGSRWHMIGNVQRRKVREVARLFHTVDALDRPALVEALGRHCLEVGKRLPVLVEVNVSGEASKYGYAPSETEAAVAAARAMPALAVEGLMTMTPLTADPGDVRSLFVELRRQAEALGLERISMGMSNDFEVAIEEGSTEVRIGRALFK